MLLEYKAELESLEGVESEGGEAINEVPDAGARFSKAKAFGDPCAPYYCQRSYTVVSGDTCVTIAAKLGCSGPDNIFYCNSQVKPDCSNLYPGEILRWW